MYHKAHNSDLDFFQILKCDFYSNITNSHTTKPTEPVVLSLLLKNLYQVNYRKYLGSFLFLLLPPCKNLQEQRWGCGVNRRDYSYILNKHPFSALLEAEAHSSAARAE